MNGFYSNQNKHKTNVVKNDSRYEAELALCINFFVGKHQNVNFDNRVNSDTDDNHKNECRRSVLNLWFVHV